MASANAARGAPCGRARRVRRLGLAWQNALEIARAGRLTAPYGAPFEVIDEERVYRLRRYARTPDGVDAVPAPLLLVPPLMVASEVYDISPDVSAVAYLSAGRRRVARRLRRARARGRRHEPHARRSRARGVRGDRSRAAVTGQRRAPVRLLAGRHVLLPGRRVPQVARASRRSSRWAARSICTAPQDRRGRHGAPDRRPARGADVAARAHRGPARHLHVDGVQAPVGAQGGDAARRLRAQPPRSPGAREARGEAAVPRRRGLRRVARPGVSQVRRRGDRRQPHGVGRLRRRRPHRHARRHHLPDPLLRRQPRRDGPPRRGARHPARRAAASTRCSRCRSRRGTSGSSSARPR